MSLAYFRNTPLSTGTQIGLNDYFTGDGSNQDFTLVNNVFTSLANTVQSENVFYTRSGGGVTGSGSNMHLSTAPGVADKIVAPNSIYGLLAAFDHAPYDQIVSGVFHLADISDIETQYYIEPPALAGIKAYFTQRITSGGADPTWYELAPLNDDMTINTGSYEDPGDPLFLPSIIGYSLLDGGVSTGDFTIDVLDATDFVAGQWVRIKTGSDIDIVWCNDVTGNTLTFNQALSYNHSDGDGVWACGTGLGIRMTVPDDIGGGIPLSLFNCSLDCDFQPVAR